MKKNTIKWILFTVMLFTVPVFWCLFAMGGIVPLIVIIRYTVLFRQLPLLLQLLNILHIAIYGTILYFIASFISNRVDRCHAKRKIIITVVWIIGLLLLTLLPLYGIGDVGGGTSGVPLYKIFSY